MATRTNTIHTCVNFLPSGERLSSVEDAEELFLDFRLTVSAIQHCQVRSKITHVYSDILPDPVPTKTALPSPQDCLGFPSLRRRRYLTAVSKVCKAAPISLLWAANTQRITGYAFWISFQSDWQIHNDLFWQANITWHVLKSWYTGGGLARTVFF